MTAAALAPGLAGREADRHLFGLARTGDLHIALPIGHVREVVPCPATLTAIPATRADLLGAIDLRGAIVPVVDLAALLGHRPSPAPAIVMVVRVAGRVLGVGLDEICGVIELPPDRLTDLRVTTGPDGARVLQAGFVADGRSGAVLDAAALAALPGMVTAQDRLVSGRAALAVGAPTLTFTVGPHAFGLAAAAIEATVPMKPVEPSPVDDPLWRARVEYNGRRLPVIDTLQLLGLGTCPPAREMACIVVRLRDHGRVALRIDAVSDMIRVRPGAASGLQGFRIDADGLLAGMIQTDRPVLLFDAEALATHAALCNLAGLGERQEAPGRSAAGTDGADGLPLEPFLICTLGDGPCAVPLAQITEIVPAGSADLVTLDGAPAGFPAIFIHRGVAVPVVDLGTGHQPAVYILLASDGERRVGFRLQGLHAVERHRRRTIGRADAAGRASMAPIIRTHAGETCTVLDLAGRIAAYMPAGADPA